nr:esterase-like activity of phytase family protein [Phenylobacterium glaciei]
MEPVFDLAGLPLGADPNGADSEAVVALSDGSFWVAEEYGPSLMKVGADGMVERRWTPKG